MLQAHEFAKWKHGKQKYGNKPYIYHLEKVLNVCIRLGYSNDFYDAVCLLHDVMEDTSTTFSGLWFHFGKDVAIAVYGLTRKDGETYFEYIDRVSKDRVLSIVKYCDLTANIEECEKDKTKYAKRLERYCKALKIITDKNEFLK